MIYYSIDGEDCFEVEFILAERKEKKLSRGSFWSSGLG